jgi:type VI secretion system protein VasJ
MLGSIKLENPWKWTACGKHPSAGDYFKIGNDDLMIQKFTGWIEDGYRKLLLTNPRRTWLYSWRFWVKGFRKNAIVCGICRDSSDRMGRPYPLIIIGNGKVPGWEDHWDLLPLIFENIWSQIEYLASRRLTDVSQIEKEIRRIKLQKPDWTEMSDERMYTNEFAQESEKDGASQCKNKVDQGADTLLLRHELWVALSSDKGADPFMLARVWNRALKARLNFVPTTVFMGGIPEKSFLAIFKRSLTKNDFVKLWSKDSE